MSITVETDSDCNQTVELDYQGVMDGTTAMIFHSLLIDLIKQVLYHRDW